MRSDLEATADNAARLALELAAVRTRLVAAEAALADANAHADQIAHAFEDFVIYVQGSLDMDACEGVSPQNEDDYAELVSPILAHCEALTTEWFA